MPEVRAVARPVTPLAILADTLERLSVRVDALEGVEEDLRADVRRAAELACGLDPYVARLSTPESPALRALAERTADEDWTERSQGRLEQEMLSGHLEGQTLGFLVRVTGARRVLEIGMFTGYSALAMAEALPEDGEVVACEIDAHVAAFAKESLEASPAGQRVRIRIGPALETLAKLAAAEEVFDLVFVDADKAGYVEYVAALLDWGLLSPGALICVDNTLMQGDPWLSGTASPNGVAIAHFNQVVADDPRVEQVVLPVRDGLTLIRQVDR